ncbi:hypothetical protein JV46_08320 [Solemya velum gill symbiont]|uniref:Uncharacterized protein n=1 Tax=Solemya velum gill symbiont TaxID=2340 RepID=A0A0B0H9M8_SOVGS|nr:hypothetical protein JV46_08320 [Solemya velum gill symbiont]
MKGNSLYSEDEEIIQMLKP